jgi:hypothetical protein
MKITNSDGVDEILRKWGLPKQVTKFLANIKYAEGVDYQTFRFAIRRGNALVEQFVASGRNFNGKIYLSHIYVEAQSTPIKQYITTKKCVTKFFIKRCNNVHRVRAFKTAEIQSMQNALLHEGFVQLKNKVNSL